MCLMNVKRAHDPTTTDVDVAYAQGRVQVLFFGMRYRQTLPLSLPSGDLQSY